MTAVIEHTSLATTPRGPTPRRRRALRHLALILVIASVALLTSTIVDHNGLVRQLRS